MTTVVDVLRRAKNRINTPEKWYQGDFSPDGLGGAIAGLPCCAFAAVSVVCIERLSVGLNVTEELERFIPGKFVYLEDYNDDPATTHADIMALFDRTIAKAEAAE